jgi:NADPH:quinone reductase-like Zn-dependent oxidoreductase
MQKHGDIDELGVVEIDRPSPGPDEVLVRIKAAALNWLDVVTLGGIKGLTLEMPHVMGADGAGLVEAVGNEVKGYAKGDPVVYNPGLFCGTCAMCRQGEESMCDRYGIVGEHVRGSLAEFVVVPARNLLHVPAGFSLERAAAASLIYQTAWRMAITRGRLRAGESVLVLGAGSGLSTALIQVAKLAGATVYATTSTPEKMKRAKELGADHVFNYKEQNWSKEVYAATGKRGVDVVFDSVGKETLNDSVRSVRKGGRIVIPGGTTGQDVELNLRYVYWKQIDILGSTMGSQAEFETAMRLVFEGRLDPIIHKTYPYKDYRKAFEALKTGEKFGKIVVTF